MALSSRTAEAEAAVDRVDSPEQGDLVDSPGQVESVELLAQGDLVERVEVVVALEAVKTAFLFSEPLLADPH